MSTFSTDTSDTPLLCGRKAVLELLERQPETIDTLWIRKGRPSPETEKILDLCRSNKIRFILCDGESIDRLVGGGIQHQGVVARLFPTGFADFEELLMQGTEAPLPLLLALDQVQDTGNVGTLIRTIYALGGAGVIIPRHNGVFLGSGARRSAAGALERLPVAKVANLGRSLRDAHKAGWHIYGASAARTGTNVFTAQLFLPAVLVLGSEEKGLREHIFDKCDEILRIPMPRDFDSLNVAQAGAILISSFARIIN